MNTVLQRYIKYAISTGAGTVVDTAVLWVFAHLVFSTYYGKFIISPVISFECAVITNYIFACTYVWKDRVTNPTKRGLFARFIAYNTICTTGFLLKMVLLLITREITQLDVVWCNLIALCFSGLLNFALNELVVFGKRFQKK